MHNEFNQYVNDNVDSSVQITPELSSQIWTKKWLIRYWIVTSSGALTLALAKCKRRRIAKQQRMSANIQKIKE
ncbi:hypothetical protein H5410_003325 [Solanum commersonii]|uniref:Uncharacterized protein n=1 Tax=Solanum commersonii TaxID=4109 RepID=A0A9J6B4P8_SOLCO|nr:hypothetical protein H5410_003325 [Solanum commersonii]